VAIAPAPARGLAELLHRQTKRPSRQTQQSKGKSTLGFGLYHIHIHIHGSRTPRHHCHLMPSRTEQLSETSRVVVQNSLPKMMDSLSLPSKRLVKTSPPSRHSCRPWRARPRSVHGSHKATLTIATQHHHVTLVALTVVRT
jgi:hypothetical protein